MQVFFLVSKDLLISFFNENTAENECDSKRKKSVRGNENHLVKSAWISEIFTENHWKWLDILAHVKRNGHRKHCNSHYCHEKWPNSHNIVEWVAIEIFSDVKSNSFRILWVFVSAYKCFKMTLTFVTKRKGYHSSLFSSKLIYDSESIIFGQKNRHCIPLIRTDTHDWQKTPK